MQVFDIDRYEIMNLFVKFRWFNPDTDDNNMFLSHGVAFKVHNESSINKNL